MKKVFLRIIAVILLLVIMMPVFSDAAILLTNQPNGLTVGENVKITVSLENSPVDIMQFDLQFDNSKYEYVKDSASSKLKYTSSNLISENTVRVSAFDLDGKKTDSLTLEFNCIGAGEDIPFTIGGTVELGKDKESFTEPTIKVTSKKVDIPQNTTGNTIGNTTGNTTTNNTINNTTGNGNTTININGDIIQNNIQQNNYNYIDEDGKLITTLPQTGNNVTLKEEVKSIGIHTKLISKKIVVPYVLKNSDTVVTVEDIKKEFGEVITTATNLVKTGDTFILKDSNNKDIECTVVIYGDFNKDGKITTLDALEIGKHASNPTTVESALIEAADTINNGDITKQDALAVQQFILGKGTIIDNAPSKIVGVTQDNKNPIGAEMSISLYTNNTSKAQQESNGLLYTIIPMKLIDEKSSTSQLLFGDVNQYKKQDSIGKISILEIADQSMSWDISVVGYVSNGQGGYSIEQTSKDQAIDAIGIAIDTNKVETDYTIEEIRQNIEDGLKMIYDSIDENGTYKRKETKINVKIDDSIAPVTQTQSVENVEKTQTKQTTKRQETSTNTVKTTTNTNTTSNNVTTTNNTSNNTTVNNTVSTNSNNTNNTNSSNISNITTNNNTQSATTKQQDKNDE